MKTEEIFFIVRIEVETNHHNVNIALEEMEKKSRFLMTDTPNVRVTTAEILTTKTRNKKQ